MSKRDIDIDRYQNAWITKTPNIWVQAHPLTLKKGKFKVTIEIEGYGNYIRCFPYTISGERQFKVNQLGEDGSLQIDESVNVVNRSHAPMTPSQICRLLENTEIFQEYYMSIPLLDELVKDIVKYNDSHNGVNVDVEKPHIRVVRMTEDINHPIFGPISING